MAKLILGLSLSSSAVERVFSTLTTLWSNQRLRLKHETIKDSLLIAGNMNAWTDSNKEEILDTAILKFVEKYHTK